MFVDSKQRKLNSGEILLAWLQSNPQPAPAQVMLPAIISELSNPHVKMKQIGNTIFEVIPGQQAHAFFKAFNADTGQNFVENSKLFCVWARRVLNLRVLITQFNDPALEQLFKLISMNPPLPGMSYQVKKTKSGATTIILNLGA